MVVCLEASDEGLAVELLSESRSLLTSPLRLDLATIFCNVALALEGAFSASLSDSAFEELLLCALAILVVVLLFEEAFELVLSSLELVALEVSESLLLLLLLSHVGLTFD